MIKTDQTMRLNKVRFKDYFSQPEYRTNPRTMYRPGVKSLTVMTNKHLIQNAVNHTGLKEAQIQAVLLALPLAVRDYALAGDAVQILNLCTLKPSIKARAVYTEAECTAATIKTKKLLVTPTGDMATLSDNWKFTMTKEVINGEAEDENGSSLDEDEESGGEEQGGEETPSPTLYTLTFKHNNAVYETQQYEAGATVTPPTAPSGYVWQNCPSEMPARDTIVASVDANDLSQNL